MSGNAVADDWSLLWAIQMEDSPQDPSEETSLNTYVVNTEGFQILKEDLHLRALLKAFLELNIAVRVKRREAPRRSSLALLFRRGKLKEYQAALDDLVSKRDEAFKKYEMLRRLVAWDNTFLVRHKA